MTLLLFISHMSGSQYVRDAFCRHEVMTFWLQGRCNMSARMELRRSIVDRPIGGEGRSGVVGSSGHIVQMKLYKHTSKSLSDHVFQRSQTSHHLLLYKLLMLRKDPNICTSCFQDNQKIYRSLREGGRSIYQFAKPSLSRISLSAMLGSVGDLVISSSMFLLLTSKWCFFVVVVGIVFPQGG